jgi:hypothetical protein
MTRIPAINERWNWKHDPQTALEYVGLHRGWHQFEKVSEPRKVWCEVLTADLHMLTPTDTEVKK